MSGTVTRAGAKGGIVTRGVIGGIAITVVLNTILTAGMAEGIGRAGRIIRGGSFARIISAACVIPGGGWFWQQAAGEAGVGGGTGDFAGECFGEGGVHLETAKAD